MTAHLLQLALGPVQDLIERARRTRDLWFGSLLLSEISKAAARAVRQGNGNLIFPSNEANLEPDSEVSIANIIVAELPTDCDPRDVVKKAKEAALRFWKERFADPVFHEFQGAIRRNIWNEQVNDIFELYAAWVPFDPAHPDKNHYKNQRQRLARLLAGRKNCRDFLPARGHDGVPKSSLDGLRETVLKDDKVEPWPARTRRRLRIRGGEQLDVLGLVKRTASDDEQSPVAHRHYPSVSRVAADPWLRGVGKTSEGRQVLSELRGACAELCKEGRLNRIDDRRYPQYGLFPFEGSALYRSRHHELEDETLESEDLEESLKRLRLTLSAVERYARDAGLGAEPDPYVAVLVADGDRMGKAISTLQTPGQHRTFSAHLAQFALDAARVVQKHQGVLVYSGGDDVMGFLPVDQCICCARELHTLFHETMARALRHEKKETLPTLSVGVAIGHFLENLEDLLAYGRSAEKHAKQPDRDGLAVHLHKRGGAPVEVRKQWPENLGSRLIEAAEWFRAGAVSNRTPYELHRLAAVYDEWPAETLPQVIKADAARVIDRKRPSGTDDQMDKIRKALDQVKTPEELRERAVELLIARHLATALRQRGGQSQ
jgi:CRISPR-associated protein Cmr2